MAPYPAAEEEDNLKITAVAIYSGGADTAVSAISTFFLAMTLYPDVMRKAQKELDSVIGDGRLPSLTDRAQLPYIDAICKEVLRWVGPVENE